MRKNAGSLYLAALLIIGCVVFLGGNPAFAGTVDLPRTGQTTCYDTDGNVIPCEGTGQDGDIRAGVAWPAPRFTDNGDGTITDNLTGLMWLKDSNCFGRKRWQEALDTVANFNVNPGNYLCKGYTATYDDWVLPNVNELESLFNAETSCELCWLERQGFVNAFTEMTYTGFSKYWSSTSSTTETAGWRAWIVDMIHNTVYCLGATKSGSSHRIWPSAYQFAGSFPTRAGMADWSNHQLCSR